MLKIFYSPGACSLAAHITLEELAQPYEAVRVDLKTHTFNDGQDYYQVNPQGSVPALLLEDGNLITQNGAILPYLGDSNPNQRLIPKAGTMARVRCHEWLAFISSDVHKAFGPLFRPARFVASEAAQQELVQNTKKMLNAIFILIDKKLKNKGYALGENFSVVDAYLLVFYRWAKHFQLDIANLENYTHVMLQVLARPAVQRALGQEGLNKK